MFSFGHCPNYLSPPPSPQFGQLVQIFLEVKNDVLMRITEPSNDAYDNDGSDNCDYNFVTFDDFGVKYGLQVTFYLPKYCKKVPIYCIKIQVKSWFVAINTSTEK